MARRAQPDRPGYPEGISLCLCAAGGEITPKEHGISGDIDPHRSTRKEGGRIADLIINAMIDKANKLLKSLSS